MRPYSIPSESSGSTANHDPARESFAEKEGPRSSVEQINSETEISRLQTDWNRLSEDSEFPNVFMTYDWYRIWNEQLSQRDNHSQRSPNVLVLKKDGAVTGISPLIRRKCSRLGVAARKIEFVTIHADYNDFVLGDDSTGQIEAIVQFLARTSNEWDLVDLRDLRANGDIRRRIEDALSRTELRYLTLPEKDRCPFVQINGNSAAVTKELSRHFRQRLRKQMERAAAEGLCLRIIENPEQEPGLLEKLVTLDHKKHLQRKSAPFIGSNAKVFQSMFDNLGPRGWLYAALVEKNSQPVAFQLGFRCGKKLWGYLMAYDHDFARLSPGKLLFSAILDYGFSHGFEEFDLLRGEDAFKWVWSDRYHWNSQMLIWNSRWSSRAIKFAHHDLLTAIYRMFGRRL